MLTFRTPPSPPPAPVKVPPSPVGASTPAESTETAAAEAAPPASPLPPAAPAAPPAPMTYASLAKSWATVAADSGSGVGAAAAVGAPASAASPSGNGNGIATSNGGWGAPDPAVAAVGAGVGGVGLTIEQPVGQPGPGVVQHGSRPSSATGKVSWSCRACAADAVSHVVPMRSIELYALLPLVCSTLRCTGCRGTRRFRGKRGKWFSLANAPSGPGLMTWIDLRATLSGKGSGRGLD